MDRSHFHLRLLRWLIRPPQLPIQQHIGGHSRNVLVAWFLRREAQQVCRIGVRRAARDTHWAYEGFELTPESGNALPNSTKNPQRMGRYPAHANLWLEESLCEPASLFPLRAMSRGWRTAPPYPAWRS